MAFVIADFSIRTISSSSAHTMQAGTALLPGVAETRHESGLDATLLPCVPSGNNATRAVTLAARSGIPASMCTPEEQGYQQRDGAAVDFHQPFINVTVMLRRDYQKITEMAKRALVLGSGGPVGIAWQAGLLAGLAEAGVDLADADFIVGTSAGSFVGAQIAMGKEPIALAESIGSVYLTTSESLSEPDFTTFIDKMAEAVSRKRRARDVRAEIGKWALESPTISEEMFLAVISHLFNGFGDDRWPQRNYACTAVDALSGEFVVWNEETGADIKRAVASSCSVPGMFPPITINGRRYMDGGTRSATNADLVKGYDTAIVVAVSGAAGDPKMAEQFRKRLNSELATLRESGTKVELILPDAASIQAFGTNLLDASRSGEALQAGLAEGNAQAAFLRAVWLDDGI